ncbi:MAG: hypothetical protein QM767_07770 [Anaeromyxobacter sp.]
MVPGGMFRVALKLALAAAVLAAVWAFVPIGGRTLSDRWKRARTPVDFVERGWAELRGPSAPPAADEQAPPRRPPAGKPAQRQAAAPPPARKPPVETHSEADRKALDRLLSQELQQHDR